MVLDNYADKIIKESIQIKKLSNELLIAIESKDYEKADSISGSIHYKSYTIQTFISEREIYIIDKDNN